MSNTARNRLNRIVRVEIPGGDETLDALELFNKIALRADQNTKEGEMAELARRKLENIASVMRDWAVNSTRDPKG